MNYARHRGTGDCIFFSSSMPGFLEGREQEYAFWQIPSGQNPSTFKGRVIAEDLAQRCARMRHTPKDKQCTVCGGGHQGVKLDN